MNRNEHIDVSKILSAHDDAFIRKTYRAVLGREADSDGFHHYLSMIRQGINKWDIIGRLRFSREGRKFGAKIPGVHAKFIKQKIYGIPLIGRVLQIGAVLWQLPNLEKSLRALENYVYVNRMEDTKDHVGIIRLLRSSIELSAHESRPNPPVPEIVIMDESLAAPSSVVQTEFKEPEIASTPMNDTPEPEAIDISDLTPRAQAIFLELTKTIASQRNA